MIYFHNLEIQIDLVKHVLKFSEINPLWLLVVMTLILLGLYYVQFTKNMPVFAINLKEFNPDLLELISPQEEEVNPEIFAQDEIIGIVNSKSVPQDSKDFIQVPSELIPYQDLLKPVRFGILSLLYHYTKYVSADIRDVLKVSWGKYTSHLNALEKEELVLTETEFIDNNPRKIIQITSKGISEFNVLATILKELVTQ